MSIDEFNHLLQTDNREFIHDRLDRENWITVYESFRDDLQFGAYFSALIPNSKVSTVLENISWDVMIGSGMPGCGEHYDGEVRVVDYYNFCDENKILPLVIRRDFYGMRPDYSEILEEFRLFHNLYHDQRNNTYIKIHDNGNEEEIIRVEETSVKIKRKAIRQFLAIKEMHLAIYFDLVRYSQLAIDELDPKQCLIETRESNLTYNLFVNKREIPHETLQTLSRLLGKKLITALPKERSGIWPYNEDEEEQFVDFIIGIDDEAEEEVTYTCNPDSLANYFGANPNSPHYLTPVYFRREVLTKYFNNPDKYSITDGYLHCGGLWGLRLDNNHPDYVIVFLGDLGRDLFHEEQMYWRSFNVLPGETISQVNFKRSFLGEFADPEQPDLLFKYRFEQFQEKWEAHFGWPLFKLLNKDDQYLYTSLHVPLKNDQSEFDGQVLALTKIVIDSLNEKQLARSLPNIEPNTRGIMKLEKFLDLNNVSNSEQIISFLKNLYTLRSTGVGHRKSNSYRKIAKTFKLDERDLISIFEDLLKQLIVFFDALEAEILTS